MQNIHKPDEVIKSVKKITVFSLPMNLHKHQLYL